MSYEIQITMVDTPNQETTDWITLGDFRRFHGGLYAWEFTVTENDRRRRELHTNEQLMSITGVRVVVNSDDAAIDELLVFSSNPIL